jgi:hypothetical protein
VRRQREERSSLIELCSGRAGGDGVGVSIARLQDLLLQAIANESGFVFLAGVAIQLSHNVREEEEEVDDKGPDLHQSLACRIVKHIEICRWHLLPFQA